MSAYGLHGMNTFVHACKGSLIAVALNLVLPHAASADSCLPILERAPSLEVKLFADDTSRVLRYALSDDDKLESKITNYLATDPELLSLMRDLILQVPPSRRYTIGRGIGRAALHCVAVDPGLARKFFTSISALRDSDVLAGYASVGSSNDTQLGTIGKAGGSAGSGGGSSLFTGEFGTELADPFSEAPLPQ